MSNPDNPDLSTALVKKANAINSIVNALQMEEDVQMTVVALIAKTAVIRKMHWTHKKKQNSKAVIVEDRSAAKNTANALLEDKSVLLFANVFLARIAKMYYLTLLKKVNFV